ncbi:MAG: hypothetical protein ABI876_05885, partial [Bacteroidota bacterium]
VIRAFRRLNLTYLNPIFALHGYRIFRFQPYDEPVDYLLITRRFTLSEFQPITGYRIGETIYLDVKP